jgi:hypothetical protein
VGATAPPLAIATLQEQTTQEKEQERPEVAYSSPRTTFKVSIVLPSYSCRMGTDFLTEYLSGNLDEDEGQSVLPSVEDAFAIRLKEEPGTASSPSALSSSPPVFHSEPEAETLNTSPLPTLRARSASSTFSELLGTNGLFGQAELDNEFERPARSPSVAYGSDSDTDFGLTVSSPCPRRKSAAHRTSHYFASRLRIFKANKPLSRPLNLKMVTAQNVSKSRKRKDQAPRHSTDTITLKELQNIERPTPHQWDPDERELLTVMYKWYKAADEDVVPKVFNEITDLDLRHSIIRNQFKNHLVLYGVRAYPEYGRAMTIPFADPKGRYAEIRSIIDDTASDVGVGLLRRKKELHLTSGLAQYAKSPATRRDWKSLVRRATREEKERATQEMHFTPVPPRGRMAITTA